MCVEYGLIERRATEYFIYETHRAIETALGTNLSLRAFAHGLEILVGAKFERTFPPGMPPSIVQVCRIGLESFQVKRVCQLKTDVDGNVSSDTRVIDAQTRFESRWLS